jgi:hypothetical protein
VTAARLADTWIAGPLSDAKSTNAMSVPCPMNRVSLPWRKDGRSERWVRSTTTWNDPLAAS